MKKRAKKFKLSLTEIILLLLVAILILFSLGLIVAVILIVIPALILYFFIEPNIKNETLKKIIWIAYILILLFLLFGYF